MGEKKEKKIDNNRKERKRKKRTVATGVLEILLLTFFPDTRKVSFTVLRGGFFRFVSVLSPCTHFLLLLVVDA